MAGRGRRLALAVAWLAMAPSFLGAQPRWQLVEELRIGGDSDPVIFTDIRGVVAGPGGQIFVLEHRTQELRVFDSTGKFLRVAARKGKGPGEITQANGLLIANGSLWMPDMASARWSAFSLNDGKFLRQLSIPIGMRTYLWGAGVDALGNIIDPIGVPAGSGRGMNMKLRRVRPDGSTIDTVPAPDCRQKSPRERTTFRGSTPGGGELYRMIPFLPRTQYVFDRRGAYWCAPNDEYLLVRRSLTSGDTLQLVRRPQAPVAVSRAARDAAIDSAKAALGRYAQVDADYSLVPSVYPFFSRLDVDDASRLWARRFAPPSEPVTIDVYDAEGRQVAVISSRLRFHPDIPLHIAGDRVYGVVVDEDDVPHVVRARVMR